MITIQFDDPMITKIIQQEGIDNITKELKRYIKNRFSSTDKDLLSATLDKKIKMAKPNNREKADKVNQAMESLNHLISDEGKKLSINEGKERYFISKDN